MNAQANVCSTSIAASFVLLCAFNGEAQAQSPAEQRGLRFVRAHCAQCHSVDKVTSSPLAIAPPFRSLHLRYPVESLAEAFAEGIMTGHPSMPEFRLDPGQIGDVLAYLKSLER
jgi:mono/diheme cytochrome c family protein